MTGKFLGCCKYFSLKTCFSCSVQWLRCSCSLYAAMGSSSKPLLFKNRSRRCRASNIIGGMTASILIFLSSSCLVQVTVGVSGRKRVAIATGLVVFFFLSNCPLVKNIGSPEVKERGQWLTVVEWETCE